MGSSHAVLSHLANARRLKAEAEALRAQGDDTRASETEIDAALELLAAIKVAPKS